MNRKFHQSESLYLACGRPPERGFNLVEIVRCASVLQRDPGKFAFSNQSIGLPAEASMGRDSRTVDAGDWPDVEKIMRLLEEYHQRKAALQQEWGALAPNEQSSLKSPEDLIPPRY